MRYKQNIYVKKAQAELIKRYLFEEPTCEKDCLDEDETITYTAIFHNGMEVDIKCCGVQYNEGECNTAWCEAVMFCNGSEVGCWYGEDDFFGEWWLEYDNDDYIINVIVE